MKFLLIGTMLFASVFAQANDGVKCYERDNGDFELAYIIKKWDTNPTLNAKYKLLDCRYGDADKNCNFAGVLKKVERQDETCLVRQKHDGDEMKDSRYWSLCREEQETKERYVPVTVNEDRQESRVWCEKGILHIL